LKLKNILGILILNQNMRSIKEGFSPGSKFPNAQFGLQRNSTYEWNPVGSDLINEFFKFPVVQLSIEQSEEIRVKAVQNLKNDFQHQSDLFYEYKSMDSMNSMECLEKNSCDPIGGQSVWSVLFAPQNYTERNFIVSTSQSDSLSLFHLNSFGVRANQASVVANLAAAEVIKRMINPNDLEKNILFSFFTGESFGNHFHEFNEIKGYTGSKKWLNDIKNFKCKEISKNSCLDPYAYSMEFKSKFLQNLIIRNHEYLGLFNSFLDIEHVIEVGQIGNKDDDLYLHHEQEWETISTRHLLEVVKNASIQLNNGIKLNQSSINIIPPGL
jgi:hypothetical protein